MWILFAVGALVFEAIETTIDKVAIVKDKTIDLLAATFLRNFLFWIWFAFFGALGIFGSLKFFLAWPIVLTALLAAGSGLFYTYLLKKIEVTSESALAYATPFLYLIIDVILLKTHMTPVQVLGILLLTTGGLVFTLHPGRFQFRKEFTPTVWGIFAYNFLLGAVEYYSFKYYFNQHALNEVSYYFSVWLLVSLALGIVLLVQKRWSLVLQVASTNHYLGKVTLSKGLDAVSAWLWLHAIGIATVSQVNATSALYPFILIGVVYVTQNVFGFKAEEEFSRDRLVFKLGAIVLLCAGGFLVT